MADERYEWLDKDAAEKLLRGEPVVSFDGHSCTEAEALAAALAAIARSARPASGELPGEDAALTAFRTAMRSGHTEGDPVPGGPVSMPGEPLDPVRIRPVGGAAPVRTSADSGLGRRVPRWGRPLRFGLVASFAGCALGGVALAAGTGILPGPFGDDAPAPAISVSADASTEGAGSQGADGTTPPTGPSGSPDAPGAGPRTDASTPGDGRGDGRTGEGQDHEGGDGRENNDAHGRSPVTGNGASSRWYAQALKACRDYRDGDLDEERRRALAALAKGSGNLERFCDRLIGQDGKNGKGGKGNGKSDQGGDDDAGDEGGRGQNGSGNGNGNGNSGNNSGNGDGGRRGEDADESGGRRNQASLTNRLAFVPKPPSAPPSAVPSTALHRVPAATTAALPSAVPSVAASAVARAGGVLAGAARQDR